MMTFLLVALTVLAVAVAGTLRVLWWFWVQVEEDKQRERMRQRAQGVDGEIVQFRPVRQRYKERDK